MKHKRFTEEQIIGVLKEHELGTKTSDVRRKHAILLTLADARHPLQS
jgi:putative transposase